MSQPGSADSIFTTLISAPVEAFESQRSCSSISPSGIIGCGTMGLQTVENYYKHHLYLRQKLFENLNLH